MTYKMRIIISLALHVWRGVDAKTTTPFYSLNEKFSSFTALVNLGNQAKCSMLRRKGNLHYQGRDLLIGVIARTIYDT